MEKVLVLIASPLFYKYPIYKEVDKSIGLLIAISFNVSSSVAIIIYFNAQTCPVRGPLKVTSILWPCPLLLRALPYCYGRPLFLAHILWHRPHVSLLRGDRVPIGGN